LLPSFYLRNSEAQGNKVLDPLCQRSHLRKLLCPPGSQAHVFCPRHRSSPGVRAAEGTVGQTDDSQCHSSTGCNVSKQINRKLLAGFFFNLNLSSSSPQCMLSPNSLLVELGAPGRSCHLSLLNERAVSVKRGLAKSWSSVF